VDEPKEIVSSSQTDTIAAEIYRELFNDEFMSSCCPIQQVPAKAVQKEEQA
jgi:hypothetical protein